jgi:putative redox protein
MDSDPGPQAGPTPMELVALSLAGCTAMDVISVLEKKRQAVTAFEVRVHAERSRDYPKVFLRAEILYVVTGHSLDEQALLRAIELSATKYCPVEAMLAKAFPIEFHYEIYEAEGKAANLVKRGTYRLD